MGKRADQIRSIELKPDVFFLGSGPINFLLPAARI